MSQLPRDMFAFGLALGCIDSYLRRFRIGFGRPEDKTASCSQPAAATTTCKIGSRQWAKVQSTLVKPLPSATRKTKPVTTSTVTGKQGMAAKTSVLMRLEDDEPTDSFLARDEPLGAEPCVVQYKWLIVSHG